MEYFSMRFLIVPGAVGYGDRIWIKRDERLSKDLVEILDGLSMWGGFDKRCRNPDTFEEMISFECRREDIPAVREACVSDGYTDIFDREEIVKVFQYFWDQR